jgi:sodium-dependent dicarboxylate transporter 2/3/5
MKNRRLIILVAAVIASIAGYVAVPSGEYPKAPAVAAMIILMAVLWVTEALPLAVTSLIPLFFLPFFNVGTLGKISAYYAKPIIFLFLGGFLLAIALQKTGLHRRIALYLLMKIGDKPKRLVLGFMLATALLSMWISNTATVMVMMPVGLSILETARHKGVRGRDLTHLGLGIMLGIAYAADIGGMSTPIGTPPNLVFLEMYEELFAGSDTIGFLTWMIMVLPISILFLGIGQWLLTGVIFPLPDRGFMGGKDIIKQAYSALGKISVAERRAGMIFLFAVILWLTGSDIHLGGGIHIYGWRKLLHIPQFKDASVAILAATLLFIIPSGNKNDSTLLVWQDAKEVPWGILLLFGGGLSLAGGFQVSGLGTLIGSIFQGVHPGHEGLAIAGVSFVLTFLTEITSNTAITNLILPVLAEISQAVHIDPRLLMIPATLSASCAFMMPVASPTQAIVFGSGYVSMRQMIKAGIWFNILGIIIVTLVFITWGRFVLGI